MPGKKTDRNHTLSTREIHLKVDDQEIELNGFVQDVFQETIVALVRSLRACDERLSIGITIAAEE